MGHWKTHTRKVHGREKQSKDKDDTQTDNTQADNIWTQARHRYGKNTLCKQTTYNQHIDTDNTKSKTVHRYIKYTFIGNTQIQLKWTPATCRTREIHIRCSVDKKQMQTIHRCRQYTKQDKYTDIDNTQIQTVQIT